MAFAAALLSLALLVASCSSGSDSSDSSDSKDSTSQSGQGTTKTPTAFEPTGAEAAVAKYIEGQGDTYVGDCADAELPRDRGKWCSTLVEDTDDQRVYEIGLVGEPAKLVVTVKRRGSTTLTPGLQVDVSDGDVGTPRQLTLEELLANAFITTNIVLDQLAGIGNGLADLPGTPAATGDNGGGGGGGGGPGTGTGTVFGLTITVLPDADAQAGAAVYPPPPPSITVDNPNVRVGDSVVVRGRNCGANETLAVLFDGKPTGSIAADAQGNFVASVTIPPGTTPGAHTITVRGSVCELSVTINVLGALAFTGAGNDTETTVLVGISALVLGLVLVVGSRRRRSSGSVAYRARAT